MWEIGISFIPCLKTTPNMPQILTTKTIFIFYVLAYSIRYLLNLEVFNMASWGEDKAEITTIWLLYNRWHSL